jgi:hypothetical protein
LEEQNAILLEKIDKLKMKKQKLKESEALLKIELAKQINATKALGFVLVASWLLFVIFLFMLT